MPNTLKAWKHNGYSPSAVRVFDMFPGSPNVETMVLLEKTKKKTAAPSRGKKFPEGKTTRDKRRNVERNVSPARSNRAAKKAAKNRGGKRGHAHGNPK